MNDYIKRCPYCDSNNIEVKTARKLLTLCFYVECQDCTLRGPRKLSHKAAVDEFNKLIYLNEGEFR
jgi:hypothetical protein